MIGASIVNGAPVMQTAGCNRPRATNQTDTAEFTPEQRAWATFRANCAQIGVSAWRSHEDGKTLFIVSRYGRTREFCEMQDAARWIAMVSGVRS